MDAIIEECTGSTEKGKPLLPRAGGEQRFPGGADPFELSLRD